MIRVPLCSPHAGYANRHLRRTSPSGGAAGQIECGGFEPQHGAGIDTVSVLGYDDTNSTRFTVPRLSSVHIPWTDLAENGLNYPLNGCYGLGRPVRRDFPLSVTLRASLSKPRRR